MENIFYLDTCNESVNVDQAFPCYSTEGVQCYGRKHRCNDMPECSNWVDEMGCPEAQSSAQPKAKEMMRNFNLLYRHWNDGAWLWKTYWIKSFDWNFYWIWLTLDNFRPNGRINFRVDLPKMDTSWVIGAYTIDRLKGFSIIQRPAIFSGIRRFYMVVEVPEECYFGEQLGVRITLFNYWDYWTEVIYFCV